MEDADTSHASDLIQDIHSHHSAKDNHFTILLFVNIGCYILTSEVTKHTIYCLPVLDNITKLERSVFTINCCLQENQIGLNENSVSGKNHGIDGNYKAVNSLNSFSVD